MDVLITFIVVSGLVAAFYFIAKRSRAFRKHLAQHNFELHEDCPQHIRDICNELFDGRVNSRACYRARPDSEWGDDSWVADVDTGGDDASQQVLITS